MLHDRSMKTIYWTKDVTDLSPVHIQHSRGNRCTPVEPQVSYTHDRDFGRYKVWPTGKKERFMGRGWCPPRGKEYETWPFFDDEVWVGSLFCLLFLIFELTVLVLGCSRYMMVCSQQKSVSHASVDGIVRHQP